MNSDRYYKYLTGALIIFFMIGFRSTQQQKQASLSADELVHNGLAPYPIHVPLTQKQFSTTLLTVTPALPVAVTNTPVPIGTSTPTPTATVTATPTATPTRVPQGPAETRFNFEVAGHYARDGVCTMNRVTGDLLLTWETEAGWQDSSTHPEAGVGGWIPVDIPYVSIYVDVFCDDGSGFVKMDIYNGVTHPQSGEIVGWITREMQHAVEIGWPDEPPGGS